MKFLEQLKEKFTKPRQDNPDKLVADSELSKSTVPNWVNIKKISEYAYKCRSTEDNRLGVLKLARRDEDGLPVHPSEADVLDALGYHPNILPILDRGDNYLITKYIDGPNLKHIFDMYEAGNIKESKGFALHIPTILDELTQVGEVLDYAASKNIIYTDFKPGNVVHASLDNNHPYLIDLEPAIDSTQHLITAEFAPPEALEPFTPKDISPTPNSSWYTYSLATTLYYLFAGRYPFLPENYKKMTKFLGKDQATIAQSVSLHILTQQSLPNPETLTHRLNKSAQTPECASDLYNLFTRALAKNPNDRFQTAHELLEETQAIVQKHDIRFLTNRISAMQLKAQAPQT